jgi:NADPH-dependent ferric siderophore reductase
VLAGDHSALPAIAAIAQALPAGFPAHALVEILEAAEEQPLSSPAELAVTWVPAAASPCAALVDAIAVLDLPPGPGDVWVGCEATAMRTIRAQLLTRRGIAHRGLHTRAYWKLGIANHSDHDTGAEDGRDTSPRAGGAT